MQYLALSTGVTVPIDTRDKQQKKNFEDDTAMSGEKKDLNHEEKVFKADDYKMELEAMSDEELDKVAGGSDSVPAEIKTDKREYSFDAGGETPGSGQLVLCPTRWKLIKKLEYGINMCRKV